MKTNDLLRHLREKGCEFVEHGSNHDKWINPANGQVSVVGRHDEELGTAYVARVCRQLGVERPAGR